MSLSFIFIEVPDGSGEGGLGDPCRTDEDCDASANLECNLCRMKCDLVHVFDRALQQHSMFRKNSICPPVCVVLWKVEIRKISHSTSVHLNNIYTRLAYGTLAIHSKIEFS